MSESLAVLLGRAAGLLGGEDAAAGLTAGSTAGSELRAGVDLGTASCVLVVLDGDGEPVYVASHPSGALRDGVVVDFAAATRTVRQLREDAEQVLGVALTSAATAYPPCIAEPDARACRFVCEAAGFDKVTLTDEVSAAQAVLGVQDGVIVDVGGGSTGVGIFRDGQLTELADQPGGGHHLDLVLAGALGIGVGAAEELKRTDPRACLPYLVPCIERIGTSVRQMTSQAEDLPLHLAGGALMVPGAAEILGAYLGRETVSYAHALLITPFGIARCAP
jgi:ethanolamine utilization protein EutJ